MTIRRGREEVYAIEDRETMEMRRIGEKRPLVKVIENGTFIT